MYTHTICLHFCLVKQVLHFYLNNILWNVLYCIKSSSKNIICKKQCRIKECFVSYLKIARALHFEQPQCKNYILVILNFDRSVLSEVRQENKTLLQCINNIEKPDVQRNRKQHREYDIRNIMRVVSLYSLYRTSEHLFQCWPMNTVNWCRDRAGPIWGFGKWNQTAINRNLDNTRTQDSLPLDIL